MRLGDEEAAASPVGGQGIAVLATTPDAQPLARALARALLCDVALPAKAAIEAVHIAVAAVSAMELLTWNCTPPFDAAAPEFPLDRANRRGGRRCAIQVVNHRQCIS